VKSVPGLKHACLVHGELEAAASFKQLLNVQFPHIEVTIPSPGQTVTI
jgi:hypothetical protein